WRAVERQAVPASSGFVTNAVTASHARARRLARYHRDAHVLTLESRLDLADAVSHRRRLLEVECFGRQPHLVLQQRKLLTQVVERQFALPRRESGDWGIGLGLGLTADDLVDALAHRFGGDAVERVVGELLLTAPVGLLDRPSHGVGDLVGVEVDLAVDVARRPSDRLDQ